MLRAERGCHKPGFAIAGTMAWRFTSPALQRQPGNTGPDPSILRECPVGLILRETPDIYAAIELHAYAELGGIDMTRQTAWAQNAVRIVGAERSRLREIQAKRRQGRADAAYGARAARAAHG